MTKLLFSKSCSAASKNRWAALGQMLSSRANQYIFLSPSSSSSSSSTLTPSWYARRTSKLCNDSLNSCHGWTSYFWHAGNDKVRSGNNEPTLEVHLACSLFVPQFLRRIWNGTLKMIWRCAAVIVSNGICGTSQLWYLHPAFNAIDTVYMIYTIYTLHMICSKSKRW